MRTRQKTIQWWTNRTHPMMKKKPKERNIMLRVTRERNLKVKMRQTSKTLLTLLVTMLMPMASNNTDLTAAVTTTWRRLRRNKNK